MNIDTRFDIGDTVYAEHGMRVCRCKVIGIEYSSIWHRIWHRTYSRIFPDDLVKPLTITVYQLSTEYGEVVMKDDSEVFESREQVKE